MSPLALLLVIAILIALYLWVTRFRPLSSRGPQAIHSQTQSSSTSVSRRTRQQLLRLVNGNRAVALRLVEKVKERNPKRSEQWCWEKAIYDIQRDRRS